MFYHNVLLLSSCCASSNTYTRGESALAFPPPLLSHSCVLRIFFFSSSSLFVGLGFWGGGGGGWVFLQGLENHRRGENCSHSFIHSQEAAEHWGRSPEVLRLGRSVLPQPAPAALRGLPCCSAGCASLRPNFACRNPAPCRQPDNAALTLIEIFSLVMLKHQSNQQRSGRI